MPDNMRYFRIQSLPSTEKLATLSLLLDIRGRNCSLLLFRML